MVTISKNDFIELEFTGRIKGTNEIFDTTSKEEAKKLGMKDFDSLVSPIISVGHGMTIKGLDEDLVGKELGKEYSIEIGFENAFGKRSKDMIKVVPAKNFLENKITPQKGMQVALDGALGIIVFFSTERVLVDFNNPLAEQDLVYTYKVSKKIDDQKEKISALQNFFFRRNFEYELKEKEITFKVEKEIQKFVDLMAPPFKDILGLSVKTSLVEKKK